MKRSTRDYLIIMLLIFIAAVNLIDFVIERDNEVVDYKLNKEMINAIEERNHTDSLYHEHMSKCSYILSDDVTVGHGGVLYSSYHIKYAGK